MKVLHLISGGDTGGAKTHVINLLQELDKRIDVKIICFLKGEFYYEVKEKAIEIEVYEQKRRYDLSVINRLIKEIKEKNYDLIHCHGARANFITYILKKFYKIPAVTTVHSDYKLDFKGSFYKDLVYRNLNYLSLKNMDYYIGVSESFRNMLIERGFNPDRIMTVYNGINVKEVESANIDKDFLKNQGINTNEKAIKIGILARLYPVKGVEVFIKAAYKVLCSRQDVEFFIAGDGEERENLENLIKELDVEDKVHLLGYIRHPYSFINEIDINTNTSYSESFPYVILEGGVFKKPIIASNVGGVKDLVVQEETGLMFEPGDVDTLANHMLKLIEDEKLRKTLGENLYNRINQFYSSEKMADKQILIYQKILGR
jgi:glycosyltransferase involved in cell wall biosynthesis